MDMISIPFRSFQVGTYRIDQAIRVPCVLREALKFPMRYAASPYAVPAVSHAFPAFQGPARKIFAAGRAAIASGKTPDAKTSLIFQERLCGRQPKLPGCGALSPDCFINRPADGQPGGRIPGIAGRCAHPARQWIRSEIRATGDQYVAAGAALSGGREG